MPPLLLQSLAMLKLPPPMNESEASVTCSTEYGRTYYLTIQFTFLAFLTGMQVGACLRVCSATALHECCGLSCQSGGYEWQHCTRALHKAHLSQPLPRRC